MNIEVEINGQRVDTDASKLPLVLSRRIDMWEDFIGAEGAQAKSLSDTLYLPATQNNSDILGSMDNLVADSKAEQGLLFVQLFVNGISTFAGYGQRVSVSRDYIHRLGFAVKILGDAADVFSQIDSLSLRDLPMGSAPTLPPDIRASWVGLANTTNPLIFAPMYYGGKTGSSVFVLADDYSYAKGLRPCVRIWKILEAIFEKQLGYEIVSNLYQTEMFRNLVYPFGVGDDWQRADNIAPYRCFVNAPTQNALPPQAQINFINESAPYSDPANLNQFGTFNPTPYGSGWYVFSFRVNAIGVDKIVIRGESVNPNIVNINLGEYDPNTFNITEPILFEPNQGLTKIFFSMERAAGANPVFPMQINGDTWYKAELVSRYAYGAVLDIASCLHDAPQKDFLRGLQHLFGLVFGIDNLNKRVHIDPRFFNATQAFTTPEGITLPREAYYEETTNAVDIKADVRDIAIEHHRPFGDSLTLGFAEDSTDALYAYAKEQNDYTIPLYGSKIDFIAADNKPTVLRNPFFAPLLSVRPQSDPSIPRQARWGCIVDDIQGLDANYLTSPYEATFKSSPKIAMYYGYLDFSSPSYNGYYQWNYVSGDLFLNIAKPEIPTVLGVFPNDAGYFNNLSGIPFNLSYSALNYDYPTPSTQILGLIDRYHSKYLSIIYNDRWYKLKAKVNIGDYRNDIFQTPRLISIGGQMVRCWQVSTEDFAPSKSNMADIILVEDFVNMVGNGYTETKQGDNPLLTIGYIFEVTNNG